MVSLHHRLDTGIVDFAIDRFDDGEFTRIIDIAEIERIDSDRRLSAHGVQADIDESRNQGKNRRVGEQFVDQGRDGCNREKLRESDGDLSGSFRVSDNTVFEKRRSDIESGIDKVC